MNFKITYSALLLTVALTASPLSAQNSEQRQALTEAVERLNGEESDIVTKLESRRSELIANGGSDGALQSEIITLEQQLYEVRRLRQQNTLRLATMGGSGVAATPESAPAVVESSARATESVCQISLSERAKSSLEVEELRSLAKAEFSDLLVSTQVRDYIATYRKLRALYEEYMVVDNEKQALAIIAQFDALAKENDALASNFISLWDGLFDDKLYAYNLILELASRSDLLDRGDEICRQSSLPIDAEWVSGELEQYLTQKSQLLDYELMMCQALSLTAMADSLRSAVTKLNIAESSFPPIEIEERTFILEEPIHFSSAPKYTTQNPIPKAVIYERGVNYRLSVGNFTSKQSAAIFRGAYPISYQIGPDKRWQYFIGGFTSAEDAEAGRQLLYQRGFRRPEVVMWRDGVMRNITRDPLPAPIGYRVEISGKAELGEALVEALKERAEGCTLVRVSGNSYVLGIIAEKATATAVVEYITSQDAKLRTAIIDILPE